MSSEELTVLNEIKAVLESIDDRLKFQSKLMEDLFMDKDEAHKRKVEMMEGPLSMLQGIISNTLSKMPDGAQKDNISNVQDALKNMGGVEK